MIAVRVGGRRVVCVCRCRGVLQGGAKMIVGVEVEWRMMKKERARQARSASK